MHKNRLGLLKVFSVSKDMDAVEGPKSLPPNAAPARSTVQLQWEGCLALAGNGNREKIVSQLQLGNAARFIHAYIC